MWVCISTCSISSFPQIHSHPEVLGAAAPEAGGGAALQRGREQVAAQLLGVARSKLRLRLLGEAGRRR
uniref:Uncharacterized protein n=1 Tax=Oryza nivara TaxID=4536 RepID=A0A0E0H581_ORYNI